MFQVSEHIFYNVIGWTRVTVNEYVDTIAWVHSNATHFWYVRRSAAGVHQFYFLNEEDADKFKAIWR